MHALSILWNGESTRLLFAKQQGQRSIFGFEQTDVCEHRLETTN